MRSDLDTDRPARLHPLIADRWSPRDLDPTGEVTTAALHRMLEAARWAPSYGNTQPARYLVGPRGTDTFDRVLALLDQGNQSWARDAGALLVACAQTANEKGELPYAEYGLGLATENLVLQAVEEGLVAHQMAGFDRAGVAREFELPDTVRPMVTVAVGVLADVPATRPRKRQSLAELSFTGRWGTPFVTPADG